MRIVFSLILLTTVLSSPLSASAASDRQKFENRASKSASPDFPVDLTPPVLCVCKDGTFGYNDKLGGLVHFISDIFETLAVVCQVPLFSDGELSGTYPCSTWVILPK